MRTTSLLLLTGSLIGKISADVDEVCGYAPLCGSPNQEFSWQEGVIPEGFEGTVILGAEISFEDCCKLVDTVPQEDCQIVDPTGESYRTITATDPICGDGGEDCQEGECNEYQLIVSPTFITSSSNDGCCDSCSCFGDPQCISFKGEEKTWVLCDGREVPWEDSIWEMCRITERTCIEEKDHAGNQCVYLADDPRGRDWTVGKQGSPCQPNPESPPSTIVMYHVDSPTFDLTLEQADRGIIKRVTLTLECGTFELTADGCIADAANAWTFDGVDKLPEFFSFNDVVHGYDQHWSIVDPDTGIAIALRCHANRFEGDPAAYVARINVEDLSDPSPRGSGSDGFCVTGDFEYGGATTSNTKKILKDELCTEGLQDSDVRNIYRAICKNPGLPSSAHESCIYHFCSGHYAPLYGSIEECENKFTESLAEGFCRAIVYTELDVTKCVDQWFDLGAVETIHQYYNDENGCTTQTQTTLSECQSGIILQYYRNNQWNDEIAIPSDYCADQGDVLISYCDHKYLFNRPIRILQKTASVSCGPVNQCQTVEGFRGTVSLGILTPYPTPFPTNSPTNFPTSAPTPFPVAPSPYPTQYPLESSFTPTLSPIEEGVITPCPYVPLCDTPEEFVDFASDAFHVDMSECCPTNPCPGEDYSTNRSQGTLGWYCGLSDGADATVEESHTQIDCEDNWEVTVQVMFSHEEECCKKCSCYGDPRCYSFDGSFDEFILCDGRTEGETVDDRCIIRKETCEAQRDHEGNSCKWTNPNKNPPNYKDGEKQEYEETKYQTSRWGSPCRYDEAESGAATMLLYETSSYVLEVQQGERGYIQSVHVTTGDNVLTMGAERCLKGDDWEVTQGSADSVKTSRTKYGNEYIWTLEDIDTAIVLKIRCTGHLYNNKWATYFINVEALLEHDEDRIEGASGFCATNEISEKSLATTSHTEDLRDGGYCDHWNEESSEIMLREVVRIITNNPGVPSTGVETAYRLFCNSYFSPGWSSVGKCVDAFTKSSSAKELIYTFCKASTVEQTACEENLEIIAENDGYKLAFQQGYQNYIVNYEMECQVKFSDLPSSIDLDSDDCETGVELQFYNPRKEKWVTYAAFPDNGPCSSYSVTGNYDDHPKLFKNPMRLVQKHDFNNCNSCTYASGVMGWFTFTQ